MHLFCVKQENLSISGKEISEKENRKEYGVGNLEFNSHKV